MRKETHRRVVVTGLGAIAPNGIGKEAFWDATHRGVSGIQLIQRFSTENLRIHVAGEIRNFVVKNYIDRKLENRTDRMTHLVLPAVQEALQDARLVIAEENPQRIGVVIANTLSGVNYGERELAALHTRGPRGMSAYTAIAWLQVANIGQTTIRFGVHGYSKTPVNDTVGGLDALWMSYEAIRRGEAEVIIAGGCEAMLNPAVLLVLGYSDDFATGDDIHAYRPFDRRASGLIIAEGAGICILEEYEHARQRRATIYGEVVGYGQTNDAHGLLPPSSNGTQYARAIRQAMESGGVQMEDIAYVSLDGRAMPYSDAGEVEALHMTFGSELTSIPVSVPRTLIGHSYAAAGALDAVTGLLALRHRLIPPTMNCEQIDPRYGLNMVQNEARPIAQQAQTVLLGGRAIGGANVVVGLKQLPE